MMISHMSASSEALFLCINEDEVNQLINLAFEISYPE